MSARPERVLLFRSGRHLHVAMEALRADAPDCEITVVATPAAIPVLDQLGIEAERRIIYNRTPFFRPWPFLNSGCWRRVVGRFDRVCVLWNDPLGSGAGNVDHTAMLVAPSGFVAITPDGSLVTHRSLSIALRELRRGLASVGVALALGLLLFFPARLLRPFRS
jgi:hypothetical protein